MENERQSAFPITIEDNGNASVTHLGLSKREYFAAMAMQAIIIKDGVPSEYHWAKGIKDGKPDLAKKSCDIADALLKALETKSE